MFVEEFKRSPKSAWIMKPVGRAQGKGIFLFQKLADIDKWKEDTRWDHKEESENRDAYIVSLYATKKTPARSLAGLVCCPDPPPSLSPSARPY